MGGTREGRHEHRGREGDRREEMMKGETLVFLCGRSFLGWGGLVSMSDGGCVGLSALLSTGTAVVLRKVIKTKTIFGCFLQLGRERVLTPGPGFKSQRESWGLFTLPERVLHSVLPVWAANEKLCLVV